MIEPRPLLFLLTLALNLLAALWLARALFLSAAGRFFATLAAVSLQIGFTTFVPSCFQFMTAWTVLATQAALSTGLFLALRRRPGFVFLPLPPARRPNLSLPAWTVLFLLLILLANGAYWAANTTILHGDEVSYHASRPLYHIALKSVFPFLSHNFRHYLLPGLSENHYLYPILFTASEPVGRFFFWLGFPVAFIAFALVARAAAIPALPAALALVLFAFAPLTLSHMVTLKPEVWVMSYLLGFAWCLIAAFRDPERCGRYYHLAAVLLVLAVSCRPYCLILVPVLVAAVLLRPAPRGLRRRFSLLAATAAAAALLSGLLPVWAFAVAHFGHPFGPAQIRDALRPRFSPRVLHVHAARALLEFTEPPEIPMQQLWHRSAPRAASLAESLGAATPLDGENQAVSWPGLYRYYWGHYPTRFGPAGLIALLSFLASLSLLFRKKRFDFPETWLILSAAALLAGILYGIRWQAGSQVPLRFLLNVFPLLLLAGFVWLAPRLERYRPLAALLLVLAAAHAVHAYRTSFAILDQLIHTPRDTTPARHAGFAPVMAAIPPGSRILFFGVLDPSDYLLFDPSQGFNRAVIPWGPRPVDEARLLKLIERHRITHVLLQQAGQFPHDIFPPQSPATDLQPILAGRHGWRYTAIENSASVLFIPPEPYTPPPSPEPYQSPPR